MFGLYLVACKQRFWSTPKPWRASFLLLACSVLPDKATAQEYCVACSEPEAIYRCQIERVRPDSGLPLKLHCVSEIARRYGHGTCRVTGGTVFQCDGKVVQVSLPEPASETPSARSDPPAGPAIGSAPRLQVTRPTEPREQSAGGGDPPVEADKTPPKTVERLAKEAVRKSGETLNDAGSAMSKAAKKSWRCLTSLFKDC